MKAWGCILLVPQRGMSGSQTGFSDRHVIVFQICKRSQALLQHHPNYDVRAPCCVLLPAHVQCTAALPLRRERAAAAASAARTAQVDLSAEIQPAMRVPRRCETRTGGDGCPASMQYIHVPRERQTSGAARSAAACRPESWRRVVVVVCGRRRRRRRGWTAWRRRRGVAWGGVSSTPDRRIVHSSSSAERSSLHTDCCRVAAHVCRRQPVICFRHSAFAAARPAPPALHHCKELFADHPSRPPGASPRSATPWWRPSSSRCTASTRCSA